VITSRIYRNGALTSDWVDLDQISELSEEPNTFFWVDLVNPTEHQLAKVGRELGFHELAIEDALKGRQRPKLEHYDSHLFINAYAVSYQQGAELGQAEISVFVTSHGVITLRDDESFKLDELTKRWDDSAVLAGNGVGFLLWGLLDVIVDSYFVVVQKLDDEIDALEDMLFEERRKDSEIQKRSYELRKAIVVLRRIAVPMREVINPIVRRDAQVISDGMLAYFQDIYDHVMRVADWTDSLRDLVTTLLETNLTIQGNNMNLIMKKLTSWAAIIAVPTAITGFYGQNVPFPGFGSEWGFFISSGIMVIGSVVLYFAFKRRDWL
jgi:magnesium transporter